MEKRKENAIRCGANQISLALLIYRDSNNNPLYDYSKVEYKNRNTSVKIICKNILMVNLRCP